MREVVAAWTRREVVIPGTGTFRVRGATVREALVVMALREEAEAGDADAQQTVRETAAPWLGSRLYSVLFSDLYTWARRMHVLTWLLAAGAPEPERQREQQDELGIRAKADSWSTILAEYERFYGLPSAAGEDWLTFLRRSFEMDRIAARVQLKELEWYVGAKGGTETFDEIRRRAGYGMELPPLPEDMDDTWYNAELDKIAKMRERRKGKARARA